MEFISGCYSIEQLEKICKDLVVKKQAEVIHDSSKGNDKFFTTHYLIQTGEDSTAAIVFGSQWNKVNIRFWYDRRVDRAGIKMTKEGFNMILHSVILAGLLAKFNIRTNGKTLGIDEIKGLLRRTVQSDVEVKP